MGKDIQECKWPYAVVDGQRKHISEAVRGERGVCPICGEVLVARIGVFRARHWWHANGCPCDVDWYEPKGPWHWYWQNQFPENWREVVLEREGVKHIADIRIESGSVVEVQWSAISIEKILQREAFYKSMLWIVGMTRIERDRSVKGVIDEGREVDASGRVFHLINEYDLPQSQKWLHATRPVFFDFEGTWENPEGDGDLYYLMPAKDQNDIWRYCLRVSRQELVSALREGSARQLFLELKAVRERHIQARAEELRQQESQVRREMIEQREATWLVEREMAKPYLPYTNYERNAVEFVTRRFHTPPRFALTLGWFEAWLIIQGCIEHDEVPLDFSKRAPYGRLALHFAEHYAPEEYAKDREKALEMIVKTVCRLMILCLNSEIELLPALIIL